MQLEWTSTHSITFPNGTLDCPSAVTGYCKILAKVNANGTLMDHLSMQIYSAPNPNYALFVRNLIGSKSPIKPLFKLNSCR